MADYGAYREAVGISSTDMVLALKPHFPSITKQIISIVNSPQLYGCCLIPEAEDKLAIAFGEGPGLSHPVRRFFKRLKHGQRRAEKRRKGYRCTLWLSDDTYFRLLSMKTKTEYKTFQALLEAALVEFIERQKKEEIIYVE